MRLAKEIFADYRRYRATGYGCASALLAQGLWATATYRTAHTVLRSTPAGPARLVLRAICYVAEKTIEVLTGISLPASCEIGPGLYIAHFGQIIVSCQVRIGTNCNLSQGVTLGMSVRGVKQASPKLGDRVFVGPNAVILGDVEIGDDAVIGAGAVVTKSVAASSVVAGNPARAISCAGSFDVIRYDHSAEDPERAAAQDDLRLKHARRTLPESQTS